MEVVWTFFLSFINFLFFLPEKGGAMVLGKLPVSGRPSIWITVGQGLTALAVGAGGGLFGHFGRRPDRD